MNPPKERDQGDFFSKTVVGTIETAICHWVVAGAAVSCDEGVTEMLIHVEETC
jgi:hypothetical protein